MALYKFQEDPVVGVDWFFYRESVDSTVILRRKLTREDIQNLKLIQDYFYLLLDEGGSSREMSINLTGSKYLLDATKKVIASFSNDLNSPDGCKVRELDLLYGWKPSPPHSYALHFYTDDKWIAERLKFCCRILVGGHFSMDPYSSMVALQDHLPIIKEQLMSLLHLMPTVRREYFLNPPPPLTRVLQIKELPPPPQSKTKYPVGEGEKRRLFIPKNPVSIIKPESRDQGVKRKAGTLIQQQLPIKVTRQLGVGVVKVAKPGDKDNGGLKQESNSQGAAGSKGTILNSAKSKDGEGGQGQIASEGPQGPGPKGEDGQSGTPVPEEIGERCSGFSGERKPYKCKVCKKKFKTMGTLEVHLRSHSSLRKYPCGYCSACFKNANHRSRHWGKLHPTKNPFKCGSCDEKFKTYPLLVAHSKGAHPGQKSAKKNKPSLK